MLLVMVALNSYAATEKPFKLTDSNTIQLTQDIKVVQQKRGFTKITDDMEGHTLDPGMPELPTHTTLFMLEPGQDYHFEYIVEESYTLHEMSIYPYQDDLHHDDLNRAENRAELMINTEF